MIGAREDDSRICFKEVRPSFRGIITSKRIISMTLEFSQNTSNAIPGFQHIKATRSKKASQHPNHLRSPHTQSKYNAYSQPSKSTSISIIHLFVMKMVFFLRNGNMPHRLFACGAYYIRVFRFGQPNAHFVTLWEVSVWCGFSFLVRY